MLKFKIYDTYNKNIHNIPDLKVKNYDKYIFKIYNNFKRLTFLTYPL